MKRIPQKIREILDSLSIIEEALPSSEEEFTALGLVKDGIYKRLEFCIQNIMDILNMIYSAKRLGVPTNGNDIFRGLIKTTALPKKAILFAEDLKGMRNVLVHKYGEINDAQVYSFLSEQMNDFHTILQAIEEYLRQQEKKGKKNQKQARLAH